MRRAQQVSDRRFPIWGHNEIEKEARDRELRGDIIILYKAGEARESLGCVVGLSSRNYDW